MLSWCKHLLCFEFPFPSSFLHTKNVAILRHFDVFPKIIIPILYKFKYAQNTKFLLHTLKINHTRMQLD